MKNPREILLEWHRSAESRLDRVRQNVLASLTTVSERERSRPEGSPVVRTSFRTTIMQLHARATKIWTAMAKRSDDTAFPPPVRIRKRRGASLPAAVENALRRKPRWDLLLPLRWHLAGLSAAWLVVLLLNMEPSPTAERSLAQHNASPPRQLLTALLENRRQIAELLGFRANTSEAAPEPPAFVPKRRGEIQSTNSMA